MHEEHNLSAFVKPNDLQTCRQNCRVADHSTEYYHAEEQLRTAANVGFECLQIFDAFHVYSIDHPIRMLLAGLVIIISCPLARGLF